VRTLNGLRTLRHACSVTDLFLVTDSRLLPDTPGWKVGGKATFGKIQRLCKLDSPIFLSEMQEHRILRTSSFIRSNMQGQGGLLVSEYWPHLYRLLYERNPKYRRLLMKYAPEKLAL
jgi:hypothetical protein